MINPISIEFSQNLFIFITLSFKLNINVLLLINTGCYFLNEFSSCFENSSFDISWKSLILLWSVFVIIWIELNASNNHSRHINNPRLLNNIEISSS